MKKSAKVTLTAVAAVGLAGCGRRIDPCQASTFNEQACADAVRDGGYYWQGSWVPMSYRYPYPFYYDQYRRHVSSGGAVTPVPGKVYGRPAAGAAGSEAHPGSAVPSHGISHGGFGSTGAGHASGG